MKLIGLNWKKILTLDGLLAIFEGCAEDILNKLRVNTDLVISIQNWRLETGCNICPLNVDGQCDPSQKGTVVIDFTYNGEERKIGELRPGCGCRLSCKTARLAEKCPLGRWIDVKE